MTSIREAIRRMFTPVAPLPPGMYHYQAPPEDPRNYRLHLRLEPDGSGLLVVNASTILHLNQTAAECAYHLVKQTSDEAAARAISTRYRVSPQKALYDYRDMKERIDILLSTTDLDPETFLDFERTAPQTLSAPIRLDCALTYQLPEGVDAILAPGKRVTRELTTAEWQSILDKAWGVGIPHVIFTGGEATLRPDLVTLVRHTERNGQVAGLLSDGLKLNDSEFFNQLLQSGLDHLLFILQPALEASWSALKAAMEADLFVVVHLTLTTTNIAEIPLLLERLANMGVKHISLSAREETVRESLTAARNRAAELDMQLVWDIPVPYSAANPVALEVQAEEATYSAGETWLYVEPDGDVLPSQGDTHVLGNILTDSWEHIWSGRYETATAKPV